MASPSTINFDGVNLLITLPLGVREISVQEDIYSDWKVWSQEEDNLKYPPAFRSIGGDPLTPGITAGAYYFLRNDLGWRIKPAEEDATTFIEGNLAPQDSSFGVFVPTDGMFTHAVLGLQPITQSVADLLTFAQDNEYRGAVFIDTLGGGVPGTAYPVGTAASPVDNIDDAFTIAALKGIENFNLRGPLTLDRTTGRVLFQGDGVTAEIDFNGQDVNGTYFRRTAINGAVGTPASPELPLLIEQSTVNAPITNFAGTFVDCIFRSQITLRSGETRLYNPSSGIAGITAGAVLDANNQPSVDLVMRGSKGGFKLINFTASPGAVCSVGMDQGQLVIDASCSNFSDFQLRGVGHLDNQSAILDGVNQTINTIGFLEGENLQTIKDQVDLMHAIIAGDAVVSPDDLTVTIFEQESPIPSPRTIKAVYDISADARLRQRIV